MLGNQSLLHVEDDEPLAFLLQRVLRKEGFAGHYHCVPSVEEAMSYLLRKGPYADAVHYPAPNVVLTDLSLAGHGSALELITWLRQRPEHAHTPIVVLTGGMDRETQNRLERAGVNAFVLKGGGVKELTGELRTAFQRCGLG